MKKLKYFIFAIMFAILGIFTLPFGEFAVAEEVSSAYGELGTSILSNISDFVDAESVDSDVHKRFAGSDGEKAAALSIKTKLEGIAGLEAVNNLSTTNGVQVFDVNVDGALCVSQNIIFKKTGTAQNPKKVVIAAHYDNEGYYSEEDEYAQKHGSQGVVQSGAGVGLVMTLAQKLAGMSFEFDIEFVFFGSHYAGMAGSEHYSSLISEESSNDILLMINFDEVVSSGNTYLYTGEYQNDSDDYLIETFNDFAEAKNAREFNFVANANAGSVTGLDYTTIALETDSAHFLRRGVKILNVMSMDDSNITGLNIVNYVAPVSIHADNLKKVFDVCTNKFVCNLESMAEGVIGLLSNERFVSEMSQTSAGSKLYNVFGDYKMAIFILAILFVALWFVTYLIKLRLEKKAEEAKAACNFDAIMADIASRTYESVEELVNEVTGKIDELSEKNKKSAKDSKGSDQEKEQEDAQDNHKTSEDNDN
ncbi:MAG: M28 family peptidase [Clostridia bacterium]|nr:M28 family peptidase [Clostridia bacterium]